MAMIKNLLFDLGGVLVDLQIEQSLNALAALMNTSHSDGSPITGMDLLGGSESELMQAYQTGQITTDQFLDAVLSVCRQGTTRQQVLDAWYAMLQTIPAQRLEMLYRLKQAGFAIYILSNINEAHVEWVWLHYPELHKIAEKVFYSNEIGIAKPDIEAYQYVIAHANINPAETLYIDDLEQNIRSGKAAGFVSLQALGDEWLPAAEKLLTTGEF